MSPASLGSWAIWLRQIARIKTGVKSRNTEHGFDKSRTGKRGNTKHRFDKRQSAKPRNGKPRIDKSRTRKRGGTKPGFGKCQSAKPGTGKRGGAKPRSGKFRKPEKRFPCSTVCDNRRRNPCFRNRNNRGSCKTEKGQSGETLIQQNTEPKPPHKCPSQKAWRIGYADSPKRPAPPVSVLPFAITGGAVLVSGITVIAVLIKRKKGKVVKS